MSKPEKLQIPLRKAGYKVMGDLVKGQMGLQATYHGAQLIDDSWYFLACPPAGATLVPYSPLAR
ncbi:hypothetical protein ACQX2H_03550 [Corynebacterium diphtheriae]